MATDRGSLIQAPSITRAAIAALAALCVSGAACDDLLRDEGSRLSVAIGESAHDLATASASERTLVWTPLRGVTQRYTIEIAVARVCPAPCTGMPADNGGLTVWVERGRGGFSNYHVGFVNVPVRLRVEKHDTPVTIVLRKTAGGIDVVALR